MAKQYAAFLSFAKPDRPLAEAIHQLFWEMGEPTYFAPQQLPQIGSPAWREAIIRGIHQSYCFVPIYTRHSIRRPWVLYESGLADSIGLKRYPARVSSIDICDIDYLPNPGAFVFDLFNIESLESLIINIRVAKNGDEVRHQIIADVRETVNQSAFTKEIIKLAKTRWVFIAGNVPKDEALKKSHIKWFKNKQMYETRLGKFAEALTEELLDKGFSVSACPQVRAVGMNVINKAIECLAKKDYSDPVDFKIGGSGAVEKVA